MNDTIKVVQAFEDSNVLLKGVTKMIENETKEQKGGFLSILLGTVGASLLGNLLTGKGMVRAGSGNNKGKGIVSASSGNNKGKGVVRAGFMVVLCPLLRKNNWIFNEASSFNKL